MRAASKKKSPWLRPGALASRREGNFRESETGRQSRDRPHPLPGPCRPPSATGCRDRTPPSPPDPGPPASRTRWAPTTKAREKTVAVEWLCPLEFHGDHREARHVAFGVPPSVMCVCAAKVVVVVVVGNG